jgi:hypothetical protein
VDVSGLGPGRHYGGIGPPGLENLNDGQKNEQCEKGLFHTSSAHRKLSAIGNSFYEACPEMSEVFDFARR